MADVFISYAQEDRTLAATLAAQLHMAGFSIWWDREISGGSRYPRVIETELADAKAILVVWTRASINSDWVADEAEAGRDSGRLVPISPDHSVPPLGFRQFQVIDFETWRGTHDEAPFRQLQSALARLVPAAITATTSGDARSEKSSHAPIAIAVLPFVNTSSDPEQEYFSDGLSEELIHQLARFKGLAMAGRTSSFAFKGKAEDARRIGEKLGVAYVLEGSVRKSGSRLRITTRLVKCADGFQLWSERFDRGLADVFEVQDEIAQAVARALALKLGVKETARAPGGSDNVEAFDQYLLAKALYHQSSGGESLYRAMKIFRHVLTLDPDFALGWYGLYETLVYALVVFPMRSADIRQELEHAGARIQTLAPDAWWTLAMRTDQLLLEHRWSDAESAARGAVASAPASEVDALAVYAKFLMNVGRIDDAVEVYRNAARVDPLSLRVSGFLQMYLFIGGRSDEAQAEYERSRDLDGDHGRWELVKLHRLWKDPRTEPAEAAAQFHRVAHQTPQGTLLRELMEVQNEPAKARAVLRAAFDDPSNQNAISMTGIFLNADHFGDVGLALTAMRRAIVDERKSNLEGMWWVFETNLRADPRFKEIVRDIGLADYWRATGNWGQFARPLGAGDFEVIR